MPESYTIFKAGCKHTKLFYARNLDILKLPQLQYGSFAIASYLN